MDREIKGMGIVLLIAIAVGLVLHYGFGLPR